MSTTPTPKPAAPFTRLQVADPVTYENIHRIIQDIYDKLNQIWAKVNSK